MGTREGRQAQAWLVGSDKLNKQANAKAARERLTIGGRPVPGLTWNSVGWRAGSGDLASIVN